MKKLLMIALLFGFSFGLAACNGEEADDDDEALLEEAAGTLQIYSTDMNEIRGNFRVPLEGRNDVSISWEVTPSDVLELDETFDGDMAEQLIRVDRPASDEGNVDVTLTATITLGDYETTREFDGTVRALDEGTVEYDSFADLYDNASMGDTVIVTGTVVHKVGGGYFLWDGEQAFSVYGGGDVSLGDEVEVMGEYDSYYTLHQIGGPDNEEILNSGNDYSVDAMEIEESSLEQFLELDTDENPGRHGMPYRVEGLVVEGDLAGSGYTNYYLQDIDNPDLFVLMYHAQNEGALDWLGNHVGEYVSITISLYTDHASDGFVGFFDENNFEYEVLDIDEEAMLNIGVGEIEQQSYTFYDELTLPTAAENGTTFSEWTSGNSDILDDSGELVARPDETTTVTFTGKGEYESSDDIATNDNVEIEVLVVGENNYTATSVDETLNMDDGEYVHTEGIVTGFSYSQTGFFIQDEDGEGIFVRGFDRDEEWIDELEVGNKVSVFGTLGRYIEYGNNQRQITDDKLLTSNDEGDHALNYETDMNIENIVNDFVPYDDDAETGLRGGETNNRLYTFENITFDFVDFGDANYEMDGVDANIIFDIDQLEEDFDIDYDIDDEFASISFIVQDVHFDNHRVVVTDFELAD